MKDRIYIADFFTNNFIKFSSLKWMISVKDWDAFIVYLRKVEYLRNPAKHHRLLYPHEVLLLEGIAGEIEHYIAIDPVH